MTPQCVIRGLQYCKMHCSKFSSVTSFYSRLLSAIYTLRSFDTASPQETGWMRAGWDWGMKRRGYVVQRWAIAWMDGCS